MAIIERITFQIPHDKWDELWEAERKMEEIEQSRYGFPPRRRYRPQHDPGTWDTYIVEREWESRDAMEAALDKLRSDPDLSTLSDSPSPIYANGVTELYTLLELPSDSRSST